MDESAKYAAISIPPRESRPADVEAPPVGAGSVGAALFADTIFAEIECEINPNRSNRTAPAPADAALRFFSSVTPPQPIAQKAFDPIRQMFFEMRSLVTDRPFAKNDAEFFYRQAKFMEDFTDDYGGDAKFSMYFPYYQHMGYEQLRTYFTWRTKVRQGEILQTCVSYAFLYIYELLSGFGVEDAVDGLNKLVSIWDEFIKFAPALENYMPQWIKDYHVYYELPHSFIDFAREHKLQKYYSLSLIFETNEENSLELWNSISSYDITQSKFYIEGNAQLFEDCFDSVINAIREYCDGRQKRFEDLLIYGISKRMPWSPFKHALFHNWRQQSDRQVAMPGQERYYCKNNQWSANLPIYYSTQKDFVGYIIKKTESCLRQAVNYKYKLKADLKTAGYSFRELQSTSVKFAELDSLIEKNVIEFHRGLTRTVVTVDQTNLMRIREEALGTQEKLVVPENEAPIMPSDVFEPEHKAKQEEQPQQSPDGWSALQDALNITEHRALAIVLNGEVSIKTFADENGIMLEVLADSINEKAADCIGDNILEIDDGMRIYDEYKEQVVKMQDRGAVG